MRISDWSSDVCSSDLPCAGAGARRTQPAEMIPSLQRNAGRPARLLADGCLDPLRKGPARHDRIAARVEGGNETAAKAIAADQHAQFIILGDRKSTRLNSSH